MSIVAGGMIMRDVAVRSSYKSWIVTPIWCADMAWRVVISSHRTQAAAARAADKLRRIALKAEKRR
jgi:hypothetical protein